MVSPGPWDVNLDLAGELLVEDYNGDTVCFMPNRTRQNNNASLIATAPELLEICEEFVRKVEAGQAKSTASYEAMKKAIKKAKNL